MAGTVGIDLGTTYSAIAWVDDHGKPAVIPNRHGERTTPSVVCFRDSEVLVGQEAKDLLAIQLCPGEAFFKRAMGDPDFACPTPDGSVSAIELSAHVLRQLKRDAEAHLGKTVTDAVITVPAYFRDPERRATQEAGRLAGFRVMQVINEPTAAAIAYGATSSETPRTLLAYDLGGGTFDVTVLRIGPDGIEVLASDGDHRLGGKDWDDRIIEHIGELFLAQFDSNPTSDPESYADLRARTEEAKHKLSDLPAVTIALVHDGQRGKFELTREQFERLTEDLVDRTMMLTSRVLNELELTRDDIDDILLIGGSTRMPMIKARITGEFGKEPATGINVDEVVALGAALVAHQQAGKARGGAIAFRDVTNHSLGMIAVNESRTAYVNSIILPKNKPLPCRDTRPYQHRTRAGADNEIEVFVTEGETESPEDVTYLGRFRVAGIPHETGGPAVLDISYRYDDSGVVDVAATIRGSGKPLTVTMEQLPEDIPDRFLRPPEVTTTAQEITAYLAFDLSGSMSGEPLAAAKEAARGFLHNCDLTHSSMGIIAFSDTVAVKLEASKNAKHVERAIAQLACGETGYGNRTHPFDELAKLAPKAAGKVFAVVLADGVWSSQPKAVARAKACHKAGIEVIAIGFGQADRNFLREIASCDEAALFTSMSQLVDTFSTIAQVLTESEGSTSRAIGMRLQARAGGAE